MDSQPTDITGPEEPGGGKTQDPDDRCRDRLRRGTPITLTLTYVPIPTEEEEWILYPWMP